MTIQALNLLRILKKVQGAETDTVIIDLEKNVATRLMGHRGWGAQVPLGRVCRYVESAIYYLEDKKLLEQVAPFAVRLTHSGYHYWQTVFSAFLGFLFRSIAVPIFVAFVTTLITLWLGGVFTGPS